MQANAIIKRLLPYIFLSILLNILFGLIIPGWLFIPGAVIGYLLFWRIYYGPPDNLLLSDIFYVLSIIVTAGLSLLLVKAGCLLLPGIQACGVKQLRETFFGFFLSPLPIGLVLWLKSRLPVVIRLLFKK